MTRLDATGTEGCKASVETFDPPTPAVRMAEALELIASRVVDPNQELVARVDALALLLQAFVDVMENPHSTDEDWRELLVHVKEALDREP